MVSIRAGESMQLARLRPRVLEFGDGDVMVMRSRLLLPIPTLTQSCQRWVICIPKEPSSPP